MQFNKNTIGKRQYTLPHGDARYRHALAIIENPYPAHADVLRAARSASDIHRYPHDDGTCAELQLRIREYTGIDDSSDIILTNGSDNALKLVCEMYVTAGTRTLIPTPTYPHMQQFVALMDNGGVDEPRFDGAGDIDISGYNLVYFCSPNIPLGYTLSRERVAAMCVRHPDTMFAIDEAYYEYSSREAATASTVSCAGLTSTLYNLITIRTFSKAFGLAGLRIGYLVAHNSVVSRLRVLVNEKNVTMTAMAAACACLRNLDYYQSQILDAHDTLDWVKSRLAHVVPKCGIGLTFEDGDPPIYGYSAPAGYYFMLWTKDARRTTEMFAECGILVRNKDDDCPGGIRVTLGSSTQMRDVLDVVTWINLHWVVRNRRVAFDLDGTLRRGCKDKSPAFDGVSRVLSSCRDAVICSNNCTYTPERITAWLVRNGCGGNTPVYTPLTRLREICALRGHKRVFTIGNPETCEWVDREIGTGGDTYDAVFLACDFYIDDATMRWVCHIASKGAPIYYADESTCVSLSNCSDFDEDGELLIPDIGSWVEPLRRCGYCLINIGKPYPLAGMCDVVVGDNADTDGCMARESGAFFVHVGGEASLPFDGGCGVPSVADL